MDSKDMIRKELIGNKKIEDAIRIILEEIGEDPDRDGLQRTPYRMTKAYAEWFSGYGKEAEDVLDRTFDVDYTGMVVVKDIKFYGFCEHHLAPIVGVAHVAYIPRDRVVGLDKIVKLVEIYSRRLQTQEQLTHQIADGMQRVLDPLGVAVQIEAFHFCVASRETKNQSSTTVTTKLLGEFGNRDVKDEFYQAIGNNKVSLV